MAAPAGQNPFMPATAQAAVAQQEVRRAREQCCRQERAASWGKVYTLSIIT